MCASAIGFYGETGDEEFAEDSPPGDDFLAEVCQDWELAAQKAEALGIRVVRLRFGHVLGKGGRITPNHASPVLHRGGRQAGKRNAVDVMDSY